MVKDREESLKINKEMLHTLILDGSDLSEREKEIIKKLNAENQQLLEKQRVMSKQIEDTQANNLITQQIIEDLR